VNEHVEQVLTRNRNKGALIDTNLLLLLFVGSVRRELIGNFKRVNKFAVEDYDTLFNVVNYFGKVFTTPNILTEVSNLAGQLSGTDRDDCFQNFSKTLTLLEETYIPSKSVAESGSFKKFGITDAGIAQFAVDHHLVITDDLPLYHFLTTSGYDALNFYHLAPINWKF
jgi:hypothetical protein